MILLKIIKRYKEEAITNSQKEKIHCIMLSSNVNDKVTRKEHVKTIHTNINEKANKTSMNTCPMCGGQLTIRKGKYGEFKGCSDYPKCKFTT